MSRIYTVAIIDDEPLSRSYLKEILASRNDISVCLDEGNPLRGIELINRLKPEICFLDIQMPQVTGFELLNAVEHDPVIIFATAFNEYALKAFDADAIDYVLKPFDPERILHALEKAKKMVDEPIIPKEKILEKVQSVDEQSGRTIDRMLIQHKGVMKVIPIETILYFEAQDDYVEVVTSDSKFLVYRRMDQLEKQLPVSSFFRTHRSFIINMNGIQKIESFFGNTYHVFLKTGQKIPLSRNRAKELRKILL